MSRQQVRVAGRGCAALRGGAEGARLRRAPGTWRSRWSRTARIGYSTARPDTWPRLRQHRGQRQWRGRQRVAAREATRRRHARGCEAGGGAAARGMANCPVGITSLTCPAFAMRPSGWQKASAAQAAAARRGHTTTRPIIAFSGAGARLGGSKGCRSVVRGQDEGQRPSGRRQSPVCLKPLLTEAQEDQHAANGSAHGCVGGGTAEARRTRSMDGVHVRPHSRRAGGIPQI